jgi:hypothetical protein
MLGRRQANKSIRKNRLVYGMGGSSTEGETRLQLQRARLFCGGTDSYTEGEGETTVIYGGGDSSTEGETRLRRGRLVYKGGGSSRVFTGCYWECPEWPEHSMCRIYTYEPIRVYVHIDIYSYICMFVCMFVCMYVQYVCMYVCICMFIILHFTPPNRKPS